MSEPLVSLKWERGALVLLDQTRLPDELSYIRCTDYREVGKAIFRLSVRGAPAIGVAAAYAMVLAYQEIEKTEPKDEQEKYLFSMLKDYKPTDEYDEQMKELLLWGKGEQYLWTVTIL